MTHSTPPPPTIKPSHPFFGSGPCAKIPGWKAGTLDKALVARSHRSPLGLAQLKDVIDLTRDILDIPPDYRIAIIPGSATGAMECAFWNLLGHAPLTVLTHDAFSRRWQQDIIDRLSLKSSTVIAKRHGLLPIPTDLPLTNDIVLNWNGSTSGVRFPNLDFIQENHQGLVLVDITSAAFTVELPWEKMDAAAFSWQKGIGGEAAHGMLVLSPKAVQRLNSYIPSWPIPYLFTLTQNGQFLESIFEEKTINTPSMLCVEDFHQALKWAQTMGSIKGLTKLSQDNLDVVKQWVHQTPWVDFLAEGPTYISSSTIVLKITSSAFLALPEKQQRIFMAELTSRLSELNIAHDINNHPLAPPSLRLWGGPTISVQDIKLLLNWIEWSYEFSLQPIKK